MSEEKKNKVLATAGTILFHALLLLLLLFLAIRTPLPLPGEEGVEVNLGYSDEGSGLTQQSADQSQMFRHPEPTQNKEEFASQSTEETPAIPSQKENITKPTTQPVKTEPIQPPQPQPDPEPEPPKIDPRAIYRGTTQQNQNGQGEGITGQPGDQGKPTGTPDSQSYEGSGGAGDGISYNLSGRSATHLPKPDYPSREQGKVVVTIWVNREGKVVRASSGAQGTTTSDPSLRRAAEQAAIKTRFSPSPDSPDEQKGVITYIFLRQN
ncbi:MAG: TonB family protein [Bacteroidales bacterium]|jgi:TonB family protein|nr:TonB family protein [Bacteroidales bacterium]